MKIKIDIKEILIKFPFDDTKTKTKILYFKFNSIFKINIDSEFDSIIDGNDKLISTFYKSNNMKLSAKFLDIQFVLANYRNGMYSIDNICDRIIEGFSFQTNINSFLLLPYKEKSVMAININFEPMIFNIGFRQIKTVMKFLPKLTEFLEDMNKEYNDPIKEIEKK